MHIPKMDLSLPTPLIKGAAKVINKIGQASYAAADYSAPYSAQATQANNRFSRIVYTAFHSLSSRFSKACDQLATEIEKQIPKKEFPSLPAQQAAQRKETVTAEPEEKKSCFSTKKSLKEKLKGKKIAIFTYASGGFGDLSCARKVCTMLHERMGVDWEQVALVCPQNDLFKNKRVAFIKDDYLSLRKWGRDIQIFVGDMGGAMLYCSEKSFIPTLLINEYGYEPEFVGRNNKIASSHAFGLNQQKRELGILIDPKLFEWSLSAASKDPKTRLQQLQHVPESLQKAILNSSASPDSIEKFNANNRLYFGYSYKFENAVTFMAAVVLMTYQIHDTHNPTFYVMGDRNPILVGSQFVAPFEFTVDYLKKHCGDGEIGNVEWVEWQKSPYPLTQVINPRGTKTVRIIIGKISSEYVPYLHMASEPETLGTGDQTFSEEISCGKFPCYERLSHKYSLHITFMFKFPSEVRGKASYYCADGKFHLEGLTEFLLEKQSNSEFNSCIEKTIRKIAMEDDAAPKIEGVLDELLDRTQEVEEPPLRVINLTNQRTITSSEVIPFDTWVFLHIDSILKLKISLETNRSELPLFDDSLFELFMVADKGYLLRRKKTTSGQ